MKAEDIHAGKWYHYRFAYGAETSKCLGKDEVYAVMEMPFGNYPVPHSRVICEAEPPVTVVSLWTRFKQYFPIFW